MGETRSSEWRTDPDGPGSGDDRYGDVPAQEQAA